MSCSLPSFERVERRSSLRAHESHDQQLGDHVLLVRIPPRTARARRWALAHGIGDVDVTALTAMLRAERLSGG
jgi:hypothetical protein